MIKTTITRKFKDGELIEEVEVIEDDNEYVPNYPIYPTPPISPSVQPWWEQPWWQQPWTVTYTTSDHTYRNDKSSTAGDTNK